MAKAAFPRMVDAVFVKRPVRTPPKRAAITQVGQIQYTIGRHRNQRKSGDLAP
jgi:hypothetical protein